MVVISILMAIMQYAIYTTKFMMKVNVLLKVIIHYILLVALEYGFAKAFNWFDLRNLNNVIIAVSIFSVCFIITVGSIGLYTKLTDERFNEKLKAYKELKKNKESEVD